MSILFICLYIYKISIISIKFAEIEFIEEMYFMLFIKSVIWPNIRDTVLSIVSIRSRLASRLRLKYFNASVSNPITKLLQASAFFPSIFVARAVTSCDTCRVFLAKPIYVRRTFYALRTNFESEVTVKRQ